MQRKRKGMRTIQTLQGHACPSDLFLPAGPPNIVSTTSQYSYQLVTKPSTQDLWGIFHVQTITQAKGKGLRNSVKDNTAKEQSCYSSMSDLAAQIKKDTLENVSSPVFTLDEN